MRKLAIVLSIILIPLMGAAQQFVPRTTGFSKKKTVYVFKKDGTKITCILKSLSWKKGNIDGIKIENLEGEKVKLSPEEISHMYLASSGLSKVTNMLDFMDSPDNWGNTDLDVAMLGEKLSYFEETNVKIKKKEFKLMMQVLNPTYCTKMRVYGDPMADESVTGEEKSYYFKKNGETTAHVIERKNYKEEFKIIFSDCPAVIEKFSEDLKWKEFEKHVWEYDQNCK